VAAPPMAVMLIGLEMVMVSELDPAVLMIIVFELLRFKSILSNALFTCP
jgi:hypothetical protein